ncbi:MAG: riboflavin synthase [bacterium]
MFTGIIEEKGVIKSIGKEIYVFCKRVREDLKIGDSIAVSGCCLTISSLRNDGFICNLSKETLKTTNLGFLKKGSKVNLERPLRISDRLGGHIVSGHIDGLARLCEKRGSLYFFSISKTLLKYLVKKGSVAIDGVSLTIVDIIGGKFSVSIIPHTLKETTLNEMNIGYKANIEVDILAKIIEGFLKK